MTKHKLQLFLESLGFFCVVLFVWWLCSTRGWVSRAFLPTPENTLQAIWNGLSSPSGEEGSELGGYAWLTTQRMLLGWALASVTGIALGVLIGVSAIARQWIAPTLEFLRPLPASAVLPLAISIFGLSANMVLCVIAFGAMWPVMLATVQGLANVDPRLREVAAVLEMPPLSFIYKIGLPSTLPDILSGMRLSLTVSLIVSVVGEMIASQPGLGQWILLAARSFRAHDLFAGIAFLGTVGFISNACLAIAEKNLLRWQHN